MLDLRTRHDQARLVIRQGKGVYNDNGTEIEVGPGTTTFCPDGEYHGLSNENGTEDLVFMALIINS